MHSKFLRKNLRFLCSIAFLSFLFVPFELSAQNSRGTLRGTVQDPSGGRIPSAKIVVQTAESAVVREATCNDRGEFRIDDLLPGNYQVVVSANGFADAKSMVTVVVSSVRELTITLKLPVVQQTIILDGQIPSITTQSIDLASTVQQSIIFEQVTTSTNGASAGSTAFMAKASSLAPRAP